MFTPFHFLPQRRCDQSLIATFARSLAKAEGGGENYQRQPNNFLASHARPWTREEA
jgi:hypothetical protein